MSREEYIGILETDIAKLKKDKENLIKYIEDKITEIKEFSNFVMNYYSSHPLAKKTIDENLQIEKTYQDLLERIKSNNYEM